MALARVTTWSSGQTLTASALNGEFDNIINNAATFIGTLTANLDCAGFSLTNVGAGTVGAPSIYKTGDSNTGVYWPSADVFAVAAGGVDSMRFAAAATAVNYLHSTPGATTVGATLASAGSDTDVDLILDPQGAGNITVAGNAGLVPAAVSGTPAQHALYRDNVIKGWINFTGTGTISVNNSFNVTSITDNGTGDYTVTWDRDFTGTDAYALAGIAQLSGSGNGIVVGTNAGAGLLAAGSVRFWTVSASTGTLTDAHEVAVFAVGHQ